MGVIEIDYGFVIVNNKDECWCRIGFNESWNKNLYKVKVYKHKKSAEKRIITHKIIGGFVKKIKLSIIDE